MEKSIIKTDSSNCEMCYGKGGRWDDESQDQWYWCNYCDASEKYFRRINVKTEEIIIKTETEQILIKNVAEAQSLLDDYYKNQVVKCSKCLKGSAIKKISLVHKSVAEEDLGYGGSYIHYNKGTWATCPKCGGEFKLDKVGPIKYYKEYKSQCIEKNRYY